MVTADPAVPVDRQPTGLCDTSLAAKSRTHLENLCGVLHLTVNPTGAKGAKKEDFLAALYVFNMDLQKTLGKDDLRDVRMVLSYGLQKSNHDFEQMLQSEFSIPPGHKYKGPLSQAYLDMVIKEKVIKKPDGFDAFLEKGSGDNDNVFGMKKLSGKDLKADAKASQLALVSQGVTVQQHAPTQQHASPQQHAPQQYALQQLAPQQPDPQQYTLQQPAPQQPAPQQPAPQQYTLQQPTPQQPAPQQPAPQQPAPQQHTLQQPAPQQPAPQQYTLQQPTPQQPALQQYTLQQLAPQQPDPQQYTLQQPAGQYMDKSTSNPGPSSTSLVHSQPQTGLVSRGKAISDKDIGALKYLLANFKAISSNNTVTKDQKNTAENASVTKWVTTKEQGAAKESTAKDSPVHMEHGVFMGTAKDKTVHNELGIFHSIAREKISHDKQQVTKGKAAAKDLAIPKAINAKRPTAKAAPLHSAPRPVFAVPDLYSDDEGDNEENDEEESGEGVGEARSEQGNQKLDVDGRDVIAFLQRMILDINHVH